MPVRTGSSVLHGGGTSSCLRARRWQSIARRRIHTRLGNSRKTCQPHAGKRHQQGEGSPVRKGTSEHHQTVEVTPGPPIQSFQERTIFAGGIAALVGLAAVALWNSQHWRLPWQRKRRKHEQQAALIQQKAAAQLPSADLAVIVDDLPQWDIQEGAREVLRLQAGRMALEQRLYRLDSNKEGTGGVRTPFTPLDERPWRSGSTAEALKQTIDVSQRQSDPTADVSLVEQPEPILAPPPEPEGLSPVSREEPGAHDSLDSALQNAESALLSEAPPAASPDPSRDSSLEQDYGAEDLLQQQQESIKDPGDSPQLGAPPKVERPEDLVAGKQTGLLPGLSKEAEKEQEGDLLPKASDMQFTETIATEEELASAEETVVPIETGRERRSQKPVPKVDGQLRLVAAGACIPAPAKLAAGKGGEDAFFVSDALWGAIGVADGVGSWSLDGVDPSLYSRRLLEVAAAATEHGWGRRRGQGARGLMHISQSGTMEVAGTSTICIAQMMLGPSLQIANLGDSGFRIFRDGQCLFGSEVQQHSFNCPYQAGSPRMHPKCNTANDADVYEIELKEHDLVLMATDGVFDNLWDRELERVIQAYAQGQSTELDAADAAAIASLVAQAAHSRGMDAQAKTPWIAEAARLQPNLLPWHLRLRPRGGKPDDCTVVVALMKGDTNQY